MQIPKSLSDFSLMKSVCPKEHHNFFNFFPQQFFSPTIFSPSLKDKKHCGHQREMNEGISSKAFGHLFFPLCTTSQTIRLASSNFYHYLLLHAFCLFFDTVIKYIQGFLYVKINQANSFVRYRTSFIGTH